MKIALLEGSLIALIATAAVAQTVPDVIAQEQLVPPPAQVITVEPPATIPEVIVVEPEESRRSANTAEIDCLARNIYWEARGEGQRGMRAVAHVTMNRMESGKFRRTICGVVYQGGQFTWTTHKRSPNGHLWQTSRNIAANVYTEVDDSDPTHGATYFHAGNVRPSWASRFRKTVTIGNHAFYRA